MRLHPDDRDFLRIAAPVFMVGVMVGLWIGLLL